jgi:6-phosphogluconolactonase
MTTPVPAENHIFEGGESLARYAAEWLCALANADDRVFAVCLSGGSTPRRLYDHLADPIFTSRFPWSRVHWFWGDERFVPHDHRDSNFRMAREAFLSHVPIPAENIHPILTENLTPVQSAAVYETILKRFYGANTLKSSRPLFDVTLLGIGEDGHTASLFPGQPALKELRRWAVPVIGAKAEPRITLTYPVLDSSGNAAFLALGEGKSNIVTRAQRGDQTIPAAMIRPVGRLHWFMDFAAAS